MEEPSPAKKLLGFTGAEKPWFKFHNWIWFRIDEWLKYFESVTDNFQFASDQNYSAFVTDEPSTSANVYPATAAGLQDAIDASTVGDKILVLESIALDAQVQLTRNDMMLEIHPRATLSKAGGGPATGVRVSATGVRINGGRFSGWSTGGDKAIQVDAGSDFTMIYGARFLNCDTEIDDQNGHSSFWGNISE